MTLPESFNCDGVLLVDKPVDWTSHDVVNCVRGRFKIKKVGHAGTLDPNATGLVVLLLGKATKLSNQVMGGDKTYTGVIRLGVTTSSLDAVGEVTRVASTAAVTAAAVLKAAAKYVGDSEQIPPMVSAIKKNGKRLYALARKGLEVERSPRPVTIHAFAVATDHLPDVDFSVTCSKGTYIRTLADDLGRDLGCGAHLLSLRRIASGKFSVSNAHTMDIIKTWECDDLTRHYIPFSDLNDYLD
ncbi:MAG: tRNA pseudouridine(55) synthase TruB [Lentisphaeria bacterium]|nr:tRNA pseudouridine(55) synthase TruB [Lentisphaeria bacterium]